MKTIEQASYELGKKTGGDNFTKVQLELAFEAGVEFAQQWTPIEEEMPEINELCLFKTISYPAIHLGRFSDLTNGFVEMEITYKNVTHWRPLSLFS